MLPHQTYIATIQYPFGHSLIRTLKMAANFSLILCIVSIFSMFGANGATHHHTAPAPAVDCSSLVLSMVDCLSFVSNGSTTTKPEGTCCSGLKTVLTTSAECLCEAFKSSAQFGVVLNLTKALTLPTACKLHAPSASNCGVALSPAAASGSSPSSTPTAAAPTVIAGANVVAPAPSPANGGSHGFSISVGSLAIGLVTALFSSF